MVNGSCLCRAGPLNFAFLSMAKHPKSYLRTAKILSLTAILVVTGFVCWWLLQTFADEKRRHRRELELVFRETYMQTQFARFWSDSSFRRRISGSRVIRNNGQAIFVGGKDQDNTTRGKMDTGIVSVSLPPGGGGLRMRVNDGDDYIDSLLGDGIQVSMYIAPWDSLNLDSIKLSCQAALKQAKLPYNFELKRVKIPRRQADSSAINRADSSLKITAATLGDIEKRNPQSFTVLTITGTADSTTTVKENRENTVNLSPRFGASNERLVASFPIPFALLLSHMKWQILFSLLMLALVAMALYYNYRNMLAQSRLVKAKNDLISNITHELKTPIATVAVAIEAIQNFNALQNPERTKEYLAISRLELNRLNLLVDKVLTQSMFDEGKMVVNLAELDFSGIAKQVANSLQLQLEKIGGEIEWLNDNAPCFVQADEQHLSSVLYNLLDNAIKYRNENQTLRIAVAFSKMGQNAICRIADNGIGISKEDAEKVFEKFYRVQQADTHNVKGYGLGLSYVAEAVAAMQGKVAIDTSVESGTCFVVSLPLARQA